MLMLKLLLINNADLRTDNRRMATIKINEWTLQNKVGAQVQLKGSF